MTRFAIVQPKHTSGRSKELLDQVKRQFGLIPNVAKVMVTAPAVLQGYLGFKAGIDSGVLTPKLQEQIALEVAEFNGCEYCLSSHVITGKMAGLSENEIAASRLGNSADPKTEVLLQFVKKILVNRGSVTDENVNHMRQAGYTDEETLEVIGQVAINIFTNYFNKVAQTELDMPKTSLNVKVEA